MAGSWVYIIASALDFSEYLLRLVSPDYYKTCFKFIFAILYILLAGYTCLTTKVDNVHPYKYNNYYPGPPLLLHHYIARLAAASSHPHRPLPNLENTTYSNSLTNKRVCLYLKT